MPGVIFNPRQPAPTVIWGSVASSPERIGQASSAPRSGLPSISQIDHPRDDESIGFPAQTALFLCLDQED
jgi:hypothetical protein